ncbi:MAG: sulfotransferase [Holophagae bacterium]|nr:MAG: sulfotransferase [Holophagae bacterium]
MTLLMYCGHHKCATRWLVDILTDACNRVGLEFFEAHNAGMFGRDLASFLAQRPVDLLAYTNARHEFIDRLGDYRGFHVIRDPRDILVSAYFSHLNSHPTDGWSALEQHRQKLTACSEEEGLTLELDFIEDVFSALARWDYSRPQMLELKMERLVRDSYEGLIEVFLHLGLADPEDVPLEEELQRIAGRAQAVVEPDRPGSAAARRLQRVELLHIIHSHRFSKKAGGRHVGQEDSRSHYRRGEAGDWRHHFTPRLAASFAERYGKMLTDLGYERDEGWWRAAGPS